VPVDFLVLLGLFEIERVEAFGNGEVLTERLLPGLYGEALAGTDADNEQLLFLGLSSDDGVDLSHLEDHAILAGKVIELEALLANTLDPVGSRQYIRPNVGFCDNIALILFLELVAEVWVDDGVDPLELQ
jgi:hypothetical protein